MPLKKTGFALLILLIVLAIVFGLIRYEPSDRIKPQAEVSPTKVHASTVQKKDIASYYETTGHALASDTVTIEAQETEYIKKVHFKSGDYVKKGQKLLELQPEKKSADLMEALAKAKEARIQFERTEKLVKQNFFSQSDHDKLKAQLDSQLAYYNKVKATFDNLVIKSPFSGVLGFKNLGSGSLVEPGESIVTIDKIEPIYIEFYISERVLSRIAKGSLFYAYPLAYPNEQISSTIEMLNNRVERFYGAIKVRGLYANKQRKYRQGMSMHIKVPLTNQKADLISEAALLVDGQQYYIFVYNPDKKNVSRKNVTLIKRLNAQVAIDATLEEKALVITDGASKLSDGQPVEIIHVD